MTDFSYLKRFAFVVLLCVCIFLGIMTVSLGADLSDSDAARAVMLNQISLKLDDLNLKMTEVDYKMTELKFYLSIPSKYRSICDLFKDKYGLSYRLMYSLVNIESQWINLVGCNKGSIDIGLGQLNSLFIETVFSKLYGRPGFDPYNPEQNLEVAFKHLLYSYNFWKGDMRKAVASYHAGIGAGFVEEKDMPMTYKYVDAVLFEKSKFDE